MADGTTRRTFILQAGLAGAGLPLLAVPRLPRLPRSASSKLHIAGVGVEGKGESDIASTSVGQNVVALCDVDAGRLGRAGDRHPGARRYADWRRLLEQRDIDAVTISTPDHMHAPIAMAAMALGKHVYVQKPLTHSVFEARQLARMAQRMRVVTQMGNQHRSNRHMKGTSRLVRNGHLGAVRSAHVWTDRPIWPQGMPRPGGEHRVPDTLAWDLWLGVAPERPFVEGAYHPFAWRGFWDFGTGALGDMGCHLMDPIVHALDLPAPVRVEARGPEPGDDTAPKWCEVTWRFPVRGTQPALELTWYDGGRRPAAELLGLSDQELPGGKELPSNGAVFVGDHARLFVNHDTGPWLWTADWFADAQVAGIEADDHYLQWTEACKGNGRTVSAFDSAGPLTETVLLGNVAYRLGKAIDWDAATLTATNAPDAAALIRREYRKGWDVAWLD